MLSNEMISVIFPVFNPETELFRLALESILAQDYSNFEIVIVEDPSARTGQTVVEEFSDPRIRYIQNPVRTSLRDQLNRAIEESRGHFLARMDADDISLPYRFSTQITYLNTHPDISLVGSNLEIIDEGGGTLGYRIFPEKHVDIVNKLSIYCTIAHPSIMVRKQVILEMGCYQDSAPMEDWDLWCRMFHAGEKFYNIQTPLLKYRVHANAGKLTSFRRTLETGIALKKRHFKGNPATWGVMESTRCFLEKILMYLPPNLVVKLFLLISLRKKNKY